MSPILIVITSASVGVLISSIITSVGLYFERKSRREELLLSKALELAITKTALIKDIAKETKGTAILHDYVINAAKYYKDLKLILKTGDVSKESKEKDKRGRKEYSIETPTSTKQPQNEQDQVL
jgi:hypothetical protein